MIFDSESMGEHVFTNDALNGLSKEENPIALLRAELLDVIEATTSPKHKDILLTVDEFLDAFDEEYTFLKAFSARQKKRIHPVDTCPLPDTQL